MPREEKKLCSGKIETRAEWDIPQLSSKSTTHSTGGAVQSLLTDCDEIPVLAEWG